MTDNNNRGDGHPVAGDGLVTGDTHLSLRALRWALALLAVIVVTQASLGLAGALRAAPLALAGAAVAAVAYTWIVARARPSPAVVTGRNAGVRRAPRSRAWSVADWTTAAGLTIAFTERTWAALHRTHFLYDVLSYHLHLPAAWRAAGRLMIVPTPFGDPAPAYAPSNPELVYHLGLVAGGNATLAHAGQLPFAVLAALAIHATVRQAGAPRAAGFGAALAFLMIPEVWQQATTAMADVALASLFLAALPFLLRLERRRAWPDVLALGTALGLLLGTKYLSTVMALPLLVWAAWTIRRARPGVCRVPAASALLVSMMACGGFWYLRNAVVTGNPLFPVTLRWGSVTWARGLYDGAATRTSEYHLSVGDVGALAELWLDAGWCWLAALGMALVLARRTRWPALMGAVTLLFWFVVPYQQSRFLFPAWGLGAVALAVAAAGPWRPGDSATTLRPAGVAALLAATVGAVVEFPTGGRVAVLLGAAAVALLGLSLAARPRTAVAAAVASAAAALSGGRRRHAVVVTVGFLGLAAAVGWARTRPHGPTYAVGDHHDEAWRWWRVHVHGRRVAYTGSNLPLPLWGSAFENLVRYVNVSGGPAGAAHDFLDRLAPSPSPSSPWAPLAAEPTPERWYPDRQAWLANLDALRIEVLFVAALYPGVARGMAHDDDGFPIERAWADALPDRFTLAFANAGVRVYHTRPTGWLP